LSHQTKEGFSNLALFFYHYGTKENIQKTTASKCKEEARAPKSKRICKKQV
jgi:hypothetical protein